MTLQDELRAFETRLSAKRDTSNKHHQGNKYTRRQGARGPRIAPFGRGQLMLEKEVSNDAN